MIALVWISLAVVTTAVRLRPRQRRAQLHTGPVATRLVPVAHQLTHRCVQRRHPSARAVASWCDEVARRIRSGSSLRDAVALVPTDTATERASAAFRLAIDRGSSIGDSVARVDHPGPHLGLALDVLATTSRIGGPSAAAIDRTAQLLRQRAADLDERSAQAAQARLSSHVMTAVPVLMLAILVTTDDDVRVAATSPIGVTCVAIGLALNGAGWLWMRHIIGAAS